jgi:hypothetical protein
MAMNFPINPRVRAYGKARINIAEKAKTPEEWAELWKPPSNVYPFSWGECWKQCIEYKVDDFAAEVGFFIDILGLPVNAFDPDYAMFTSPSGDFYFAVVPTKDGSSSTPANAIRIQFMLDDIIAVTEELERRGIIFDASPQPCVEGSSMYVGFFRTPHGINVDLWGMVEPEEGIDVEEPIINERDNAKEDINEVDDINEQVETKEQEPKLDKSPEVGEPEVQFEYVDVED